jgi:hypothetical protein
MQRDLLMDQLEMSFLMRKRREEYIEQMEHSKPFGCLMRLI